MSDDKKAEETVTLRQQKFALGFGIGYLLLGCGFAMAGDPTCEFPLLDETPAKITQETCGQLDREPYQRQFLDYVCSKDCQDLKKCLENYGFLSKQKEIKRSLVSVEKATADYPRERRSQKCGNFEPNMPIDENDELWAKFEKFVNARRMLNGYFKEKETLIKNECLRRDNNKGTFMKFRRTLAYSELLNSCAEIKKSSQSK